MTVLLAMVIDALLGEPKWLWDRLQHPAVLMGRAIAHFDQRFNAGSKQRTSGIIVLLVLCSAAAALGAAIQALPGIWADVLLGAILLAQRSLTDHVSAVRDGLARSVDAGRTAVARIVSRDTKDMDASAVARSTIESAAENLSDGVVAPIFWFVLGGLPALMVYKMTNTADSMIGYKTPRYAEFGWAAARFDDLLNWIPARLTALMIWLTDRHTALSSIQADAHLHRSPNAGWPEAAMAHKHNVALAGPRSYDGKLTDFPYVNAAGKKLLKPSDITDCIGTLWQVWGIAAVLMVLITIVIPG